MMCCVVSVAHVQHGVLVVLCIVLVELLVLLP